MVATVPDLWPQIKLDILSPATILRRQAGLLRKKYPGFFDAELTTVTGKDDFAIHRLDLIAIKPTEQRYRILTATHRIEFYPVQIEADCYRPKTRTVTRGGNPFALSELYPKVQVEESLTWPPEADWRKIARSQADFITEISVVLSSREVRSAMESFIARSNEADSQDEENVEQEAPSA